MTKVLVFGGLDERGSVVTDYLLLQGVEVTTTYIEKDVEAEERAMIFGRNAQFDMIALESRKSERWLEAARETDAVLFFDSLLYENLDETLVQLDNCLSHLPKLEKIILLSHLEIYGERTGVIDEEKLVEPITQVGKRADHIERSFIETLLNKKNETVVKELIILRVPDLYCDANGQKRQILQNNEALHVKDLAKGIFAALTCKLTPGIHVIQLTSGQEFKHKDAKICYPYEKAEQLLTFKPEHTLNTLNRRK